MHLLSKTTDRKLCQEAYPHPSGIPIDVYISDSTACRILRKLVEEGKLKNISTPRNLVYVPDNGYYKDVAENQRWGSTRATILI